MMERSMQLVERPGDTGTTGGAWPGRSRPDGRRDWAARPDGGATGPPSATRDRATRRALLAACRLVTEALGVPLQPGTLPGRAGCDAPIESIARASRLRTRRVALRGLVETRARAARRLPFEGAVRWRCSRSWRLPTARSRRRDATAVTAKVAASLRPFGETFYRPLDDRRAARHALLACGLRGSGASLLQLSA